MKRFVSDEEKRLQKKLIPLNLVVCIICLVAALSLFFLPFLKIDVGKILHSEAMNEIFEEMIDGAVGGGSQDGEIDFTPVVAVVVKESLENAEGSLSFTAFSSFNVFISGGENKSEAALEEMLYGDSGLVTQLIDSIANGVSTMFDSRETTAAIEKEVVNVLTSQLLTNVPSDVASNISQEDLNALTETFLQLDGKDRAGAETVADNFVSQLESVLGEQYDIGDNKEEITDFIMGMYDDTAAELQANGEDVSEGLSIESIICVTLSQYIDLDVIGDMLKNGGNQPENSIILADYRAVSDGTEGNTICTSYSELMETIGLGAEGIEEIKQNIQPSIRQAVDDMLQDYTQFFEYYGYIFLGMLVFIVPWLLLFLFAFFHTFAKNKMFTMWYVKLYSFLPCLLFFVLPLVAPKLLPLVAAGIMEEGGATILALLSGISSLTIVSGVCYVLLWLFSIFWAFPIKHKIRKVRKAYKGSAYSQPAPAAASDQYSSSYGSSYGDSSYGYDDDDGFDDDYSSPYGSPPYGSYDSSYGGGSLYDDDDDDYGSSYGSYGSPYGGSSIFDDDDDY